MPGFFQVESKFNSAGLKKKEGINYENWRFLIPKTSSKPSMKAYLNTVVIEEEVNLKLLRKV